MGPLRDFGDFIRTLGPSSDDAAPADDASPADTSSQTDNSSQADNTPPAGNSQSAANSLADNSPATNDVPPTSMADLVQLTSSHPPDPQNALEWQQCFQAALQGTSGQGGMTDQQKVDLAASIATASTKHLFQEKRLANVFDCCKGKATTDSLSKQFGAFLGFNGHWGQSYLGALQTTSGQTTKAATAVKKAQGIADAAMSTILDDEALAIFADCAKANP